MNNEPKNITIDNYLDNHYIHRSNWLRASVLGATVAKTGGSSILKAILKITIWNTIAMVLSAFFGYLFGVNL